MANPMHTLSRRLYQCILSCPKFFEASKPFCTLNANLSSKDDLNSDDPTITLDTDSVPESTPRSTETKATESRERKFLVDGELEDGVPLGIYKAILVGKVGQNPTQKILKSGRKSTQFMVVTGGLSNNRRPTENEDPEEYANRSAVQWHRVAVYPDNLAAVVMKKALPGSIVYLEGNLETKVFINPVTGDVQRIREIALRRNSQVLFLGEGDSNESVNPSEFQRFGYY